MLSLSSNKCVVNSLATVLSLHNITHKQPIFITTVDYCQSGSIATMCTYTKSLCCHSGNLVADLSLVDYAIWSVIQLDAACNIQRVHYKSMKCDVFIFTR